MFFTLKMLCDSCDRNSHVQRRALRRYDRLDLEFGKRGKQPRSCGANPIENRAPGSCSYRDSATIAGESPALRSTARTGVGSADKPVAIWITSHDLGNSH